MNDTQMNPEVWHVEAGGEIFETSFAEMTEWIAVGSLLRIDRVRKGNLRWIEAGKVPSLTEFFNAKDAGVPSDPVVTITHTAMTGASVPVRQFENVSPAVDTTRTAEFCAMHADASAAYVCDTCANAFCKACPNSYGGTVKICPFCGAMCKSLAQIEKIKTESAVRDRAFTEKFGFADFGAALAYPFKFRVSLVFGAIMFAIFSLGQSAVGFGGIYMLASAIFCFLLANMLTFGVLANTVENFSQGKVGLNFMPSFDEFSLWDDVVHPFFLSIGVYISSFGPLIVLILVAFFLVIGSVGKEMNGLQSDAARSVNPALPYAANATKQSQAVRDLLDKTKGQQANRVEAFENGDETALTTTPGNTHAAAEEKEFERLNNMIQNQRKAQLESAVGRSPETIAKEQNALISKMVGYGTVFLLAAGIFLLWGLFYFPAACAVAGYTRSFAATLNPTVGLDTIKRLGSDYVKILLMGFVIIVASVIVSLILAALFSAFDMPGVGNVPAKFIGSLFGFYFSVVFSCVIGFAIYKASDRLKLYQ